MKPGKEAVDGVKDDGDGPTGLKNPQLAAKERATHRNLMTFELCSEESRGNGNDISAAEVTYEVRFFITYSFILKFSNGNSGTIQYRICPNNNRVGGFDVLTIDEIYSGHTIFSSSLKQSRF